MKYRKKTPTIINDHYHHHHDRHHLHTNIRQSSPLITWHEGIFLFSLSLSIIIIIIIIVILNSIIINEINRKIRMLKKKPGQHHRKHTHTHIHRTIIIRFSSLSFLLYLFFFGHWEIKKKKIIPRKKTQPQNGL